MPKYEGEEFDPPAPIARVTLYNPLNDTSVTDVPMPLDTGADITLLPKKFMERLGIFDNSKSFELLGFDGSKGHFEAVYLHLILEGKKFKGHFVWFEQEWGVIGRDILNLISLIFDGPIQEWYEPVSR